MPELQFENVWYRPDESRWRDMNFVAYRDAGRLVVRADSLEFYGKAGGALRVAGVRGVWVVKQGRDFINDWVRIDYGEAATPATAFFADGSWLGWGGVLGGTRRIFEAVRHLARSA